MWNNQKQQKIVVPYVKPTIIYPQASIDFELKCGFIRRIQYCQSNVKCREPFYQPF